jgi:hypothetical protein
VLKIVFKVVEIHWYCINNISTFNKIPPPDSAENNRLVIRGGDIADIGGDIPL